MSPAESAPNSHSFNRIRVLAPAALLALTLSACSSQPEHALSPAESITIDVPAAGPTRNQEGGLKLIPLTTSNGDGPSPNTAAHGKEVHENNNPLKTATIFPQENGGELDSISDDEVILTEPIENITFIGDSIQADLREIGGKANGIIPYINDALLDTPELSDITIDNKAYPGLSIRNDSAPLPGVEFSTLKTYIASIFDERVNKGSDLVVIATSNIDLSIGRDTPVEELAPTLVEELLSVVKLLEAKGLQVIVLPAFGVNNAIYDGLQGAAAANGEPGNSNNYHLNERVAYLNQKIAKSDLPLLFPNFNLDFNEDGIADPEFFTGYSPDGWPDDGIHPNYSGEKLYADQVSSCLLEILLKVST